MAELFATVFCHMPPLLRIWARPQQKAESDKCTRAPGKRYKFARTFRKFGYSTILKSKISRLTVYLHPLHKHILYLSHKRMIFYWYSVSTEKEEFNWTKKIPDTITSWHLTGFAMNEEKGLAVTEDVTKIVTFKPFFISVRLPYSVKRGTFYIANR